MKFWVNKWRIFLSLSGLGYGSYQFTYKVDKVSELEKSRWSYKERKITFWVTFFGESEFSRSEFFRLEGVWDFWVWDLDLRSEFSRQLHRRCWTRSEWHHKEKIKNGSFTSDLRSVHISRYAIKIPGEIVWYGRYRSSSAFKRHNMRCSFEIFLRKGGRNGRLLLASQNCYFLCRRD